tara:strand:+ start:10831 stop:11232 length:402 start_codon:yes stop_codon:yes gene_type:complete
MMPMKQRVAQLGLAMESELVEANPDMIGEMAPGSMHWRCTITAREGGSMLVHFSQGPAVCEEPTLEGVLGCVVDEVSSVVNVTSFEEWATSLGYDTDSRRAEAGFNHIVKHTEQLMMLVGGEAFNDLLYETSE